MHDLVEPATRAAAAVRSADALMICAGAGMGVDSGLPDFRGPEGFWRAYPAARRLGLQFHDLADPRWFYSDPALAWGFYGHRLNLYRATTPHAGFALLQRWAARAPQGRSCSRRTWTLSSSARASRSRTWRSAMDRSCTCNV
ncbi:hypothetical protein [Nannocystis pusilla]|uniref:hypothetical protein n=1 Tax=Nannocystis pusilla TaxID=889268 RepID=UPI003B7736DC